jgi:hypothetical protein
MDPRSAEPDAFMLELLKRRRNLTKQLEKIAAAELKAKSGKQLVDEQAKKLANRARYEEQLSDIEGWISLYTKTQGRTVPEKPKPVVVVEAPKAPEIPQKPDTRLPDTVRLWLTGGYLADTQLHERFAADHSHGLQLEEFLAFWQYLQGEERDFYQDVAGRSYELLQKYLEASEDQAPHTARSFAEIKSFVEEAALWLAPLQRPEAVVAPQAVEQVAPSVEVQPAEEEEVTPDQEEERADDERQVEVQAAQKAPTEEDHKRGWADEEEEEESKAVAKVVKEEEDEFTIFTKKKPVPVVSRPRGQQGSRGGRNPRGRFPAKARPPRS